MIINITKSHKKNKRFRVYLSNGEYYDFGLNTGSTYIDHKNKIKRMNYLKRHLANPFETKLINNLTPSPSLFSAYLLWGKFTTLKENIEHLNQLWKIKKSL